MPDDDFDKVYDFAFEKRGFINLGYVEESASLEVGDRPEHMDIKQYEEILEDFQAALARKLAESAALDHSDVLVDVGCGFGLQDHLFAREFGVQDIKAFNIAPKQIDVARRLLMQLPEPVREAITFEVGDATRLPQPDRSATKVFSLESAFHYATREDFFAEAYRILRPGGKLALADYALKPGKRFKPPWRQRLRGKYEFLILPPNRYDIEEYTRKLESVGFTEIAVEDITNRVALWPNDDPAKLRKQHEEVNGGLLTWMFAGYALLNYYIVTATR